MDVVSLDRTALILSANRALWGEVSAQLRAVLVRQTGAAIELYCFFDGAPAADDLDSVSSIAGEIASDFPGFSVEEHVAHVDASQPLPELPDALTIYRRKEL
jgi:hypothetical protein